MDKGRAKNNLLSRALRVLDYEFRNKAQEEQYYRRVFIFTCEDQPCEEENNSLTLEAKLMVFLKENDRKWNRNGYIPFNS